MTLNEEVARALGYTWWVKRVGNTEYRFLNRYPVIESGVYRSWDGVEDLPVRRLSELPAFDTDPVAHQVVVAAIEAKGWELERKTWNTRKSNGDRVYQSCVNAHFVQSTVSEFDATCRAFVAACDQEDRNG
jgi:hypothetical protein